jgi:UDP-N-acetylglucosamine diphosphorylase/glucosamine-1-phosphate N-acetyltransferase
MQYIIFDGDNHSFFTPLTLSKPSFDLILGTKNILENLIDELKLEEYSLYVKTHLVNITRNKYGENVNPNQFENEVFLINGMIRLDSITKKLLNKKDQFLAYYESELVMGRIKGKYAQKILQNQEKNEFDYEASLIELAENPLIKYPWQLIQQNPIALVDQINKYPISDENPPEKCVILGQQSNLIVKKNVEIEPNVTFDLRGGGVLIDEDAEIQSFSRISGPSYIGRRSLIKSARIGKGTTIGDHCKIGGEVDCSIIAGYSNKAHDGFLGHSYVGEWVNIGASTSNSDLKNTYGTVRMTMGSKRIDTKNMKVGCFLADYSKTSIGCYIYTGKRIGLASQIHGYVTEDIPSFTITSNNSSDHPIELNLDSALKTQKRMMERRGMKQTADDKALLTKIFSLTQKERNLFGVKNRKKRY